MDHWLLFELYKDDRDDLTKHFDNRGIATARIVINWHINDNQREKCVLKDLKNTGCYYIARIVEKDGDVIDKIPIDEQPETINSLRGKTGAGSI